MDSRRVDYLWLAGWFLMVGLAIFLRFDGLGEPSLWMDEILHAERTLEASATDGSWHTWLTGLPVDRENGPLYYATQRLGQQLFAGEVGARLMPASAGVVAVLALFWVASAVAKNRWLGLVAGILLAVSPLHVYYSREGRPYAAVLLAAALLLLVALRAERRWAGRLVYPLCLATVCLGAVAAPLLLSFFGLAGLAWWSSRRQGSGGGRGHLVMAALLSLLLLPVLFPTVQGIDKVSGENVERGEHSAGIEITRPLSGVGLDRLLASYTVSGLDSGTSTLVSWFGLGLALWGGLVLVRRHAAAGYWLIGMWLLPVLGWMAALHLFGHWYNVRYTSSGLPAFLVLMAVGVQELGLWAGSRVTMAKVGVRGIVSGALLLLLMVPAWRADRSEPWQKPPWRDVAHLLGSLAVEDEVIVARGDWAYVCLAHYLKREGYPVEIVNAGASEEVARQAVDSHGGAFVVAAGYYRTPWLEDWLGSLHPVLRRGRANLRVYYSPGFSTLFGVEDRGAHAASILKRLGHSTTSQEFTADSLLLGEGWSVAEVEPNGRTFRWAAAERAEVALMATTIEEERGLRIVAMPFPGNGGPPPRLTLAVNGVPVAAVDLEPGWNDLTLGPYRSARTVDLVTFGFAQLHSPRELDPSSQDSRRLAVAFDRVEFVTEGKFPVAGTEDAGLTVVP